MSKAFELPYQMESGVGPKKNVLDGGYTRPRARGSFGGFDAL